MVASYGLHATLVADSDTLEYRKHGAARFGKVANDLLNPSDGKGPRAYKGDIKFYKDGVEWSTGRDEHGYVLVTLVSNLEKPFTISPKSKPLDGQLRVIHFGPESGEQTMNIMKEAYNNGNHVTLKSVGYEDISRLRIIFPDETEGGSNKWAKICIDGLIIEVPLDPHDRPESPSGAWMDVEIIEAGNEAVEIVIDV